ncbi:hypothetical protein GCM10009605_32210 [Nocardiopsis composta]
MSNPGISGPSIGKEILGRPDIPGYSPLNSRTGRIGSPPASRIRRAAEARKGRGGGGTAEAAGAPAPRATAPAGAGFARRGGRRGGGADPVDARVSVTPYTVTQRTHPVPGAPGAVRA